MRAEALRTGLKLVCAVFSLVLVLLVCRTVAQQRGAGAKHVASDAKKAAGSNGMGEHYLLLVNTAIAQFMSDDKLRQFDKSPYDGIAIAFLHAYDTSAPPSVAEMSRQIAEWKQLTSKQIWPWVYLNRIVARNPAENNHYADNPYFNRIAGVDLEDKQGALSDFLRIWRNSITAARDANVPGIMCDLEFYNNYKEYDIGQIAYKTGKTPAQVAEGLKSIGARMADSAAEIYPNGVIWLMFTGLTHPGYKKLDGTPYYPSPAYVSIGMLDEVVKKQLPLKVLAGGEGSLGYCHETLSAFQDAIEKRRNDLSAELQKYSGVLELGGTLALWSDRKLKTDWLNQAECGKSETDTVEDLEPYMQLLLKTYRYNWVYATSEGNYLPFSATSAPRFDAVIRKARDSTSSTAKRVP